ncbi:MAG TPA: hypothetical protein VHW43_10530 [Puia sp.]|nr:hypothetical protein [Puia sp.]
MNQEREIPYDFILDYLLRIETTVKPFFGMFSIYNGQKLLLMLRNRKDQPELNGIWVPTDRDGLESFKTELPSLRQIYGLGNTRKSAAIWLMVPPEAPDFERTAITLCDLIVHRDPRIGRLSKPRSPRSQSNPKPRTPRRQSSAKPRSPRPPNL